MPPASIVRTALALLLVTSPVPPVGSAQGTVANDRIFDAIGVKDGATVCEIGAGDGELSLAAAKAVGPGGRVFTSELGDDRVKTLRTRMAESGLSHITVVSGDPVRTNFQDGVCDALFLRNVYHHFADPVLMGASIMAALRPGGRVAVVDFTPPDKEAPKPADRGKDGMHGVRAETVAREMKAAGFELVSSDLEQRALLVVFSKPSR